MRAVQEPPCGQTVGDSVQDPDPAISDIIVEKVSEAMQQLLFQLYWPDDSTVIDGG